MVRTYFYLQYILNQRKYWTHSNEGMTHTSRHQHCHPYNVDLHAGSRFHVNQKLFIKQLAMKLQGIIHADVMGGVEKYHQVRENQAAMANKS